MRVFVGQGQENVVGMGSLYLRVQGTMYWVLGLLFIFRNTLQGLGNSLVPTIAGIGELVMRFIAAFLTSSISSLESHGLGRLLSSPGHSLLYLAAQAHQTGRASWCIKKGLPRSNPGKAFS